MRSLLSLFSLLSVLAYASSQDSAKHTSEAAPASGALVATAGAGGRSVFRNAAGSSEKTHLILEIPASGDAREKSVLLRHAKDKSPGLILAYKAPDLHNPKRKGDSVGLSLDVVESAMRSAISDADLKDLAQSLQLSAEQKKNIQNNNRAAVLSLFRLAKDGEAVLLKRLWKEVEQRKLDTAGDDYAADVAAFAALNPEGKKKNVSLEIRPDGYAVAVRENKANAPATVSPTLAFNGAAPKRIASPEAAQPTAARATAPAAPKAPAAKVSAPPASRPAAPIVAPAPAAGDELTPGDDGFRYPDEFESYWSKNKDRLFPPGTPNAEENVRVRAYYQWKQTHPNLVPRQPR